MTPVNSAILKVCVEQKFDGISCSICYRNGKLVQALSRGDGQSGENMTSQVMALKSVPKTITDASTFWVRGELVMRKSELERINKIARATGSREYSSTRNLTAGTMKLKDVSEVAEREILFMPWDIFAEDDDQLPDSNFERMQGLKAWGFPQYRGVLISDEAEVIPAIDAMLLSNSQSDINADGVVIKVDSHSLRRKLGAASKYTNWMCCFKPQSASGTTYLRSIEWQVGRQGKLTPVATCDPVPLAGAMVTHATLNNITWIDTMGLKLGAKCEMLRSGDVIPQIVKVIDDGDEKIVPPFECPECHTKLEVLDEERSGIITHWCQNYECAGRVRDLFTFISSRDVLEIDGLGPEMATKIVTEGFARDIGELFEFQVEGIKGLEKLGEEKFEKSMVKRGFSGVTFRKMILSMEKAKKAPWERWIACLGIPMIGRTLGKVLAATLKLDSDSMWKLPDLLASLIPGQVEGIGDIKLDMIHTWAKEVRNQEICQVLFDSGVRPTNTNLLNSVKEGAVIPLNGVAFVITGEFGAFGTRDKITQRLESLGAVSKSGVSKKTTMLLVGDAPGATKLSAAKRLGIPTEGGDWLRKVYQENGWECAEGGFDFEEA